MGKVWKISAKAGLTPEEIASAIPYPEDSPTPSQMKREDCKDGPRPCALVSCHFNNYLSPTANGTIHLTWPGLQPEQVPPLWSCSLDVSERGQTVEKPMPLEEIAAGLGTTKQTVDNIIKAAQVRGRNTRRKMAIDGDE